MTDDQQDGTCRNRAAIRAPTTSELDMLRAQDWHNWLCGYLGPIEEEIAAERMQRSALTDALGQVLAEERGGFKTLVRDEIAALKAELLAEIDKLRCDVVDRRGEVVDLPALPSMRSERDAAA